MQFMIKCKINATSCLLNAFYLNKFTNQTKQYMGLSFQAKFDDKHLNLHIQESQDSLASKRLKPPL